MQYADLGPDETRFLDWIDVPRTVMASSHGDGVEASALEAIVLAQARPALIVEHGRIDLDNTPEPWRTTLLAHRGILEAVCAAVGRLDAPNQLFQSVGTAFLVGHDLVMTARHAAETFVLGVGTKNLAFRPDRTVSVDFGDGKVSRVVEVVMIHPVLDIALLRIDPAPSIPPLRLSAEDPGALENRTIVLIAHPQRDARYDPALQELLLDGRLGHKHVMPGRVRPPQLFHSFGRQSVALVHDAVTLGGRSGAPVVDPVTGHVVAVQIASKYLVANFAVPISELARDPKVRGFATFDRDITSPMSPWTEEWRAADEDPGSETPQLSMVSAVDAGPASDAVVAAVEQAVARRFKDSTEFRAFLLDQGHDDVVSAVPGRAGDAELVRALNRRGALNDARLLHALDPVLASIEEETGAEHAAVTSPLSEPLLARVIDAAKPVSTEQMDFLATGSQWRDYLIGPSGIEGAPEAIRRLSRDALPQAAQALAWLLQRVLDLPGLAADSAAALGEAVGLLSQDTPTGADTAAAVGPFDTPPMTSIDYLRQGIEAARGVGLLRIAGGPQAFSIGSTGWLLTPDLVVVPAHTLYTRSPATGRLDDQGMEERARDATIEFDADAPSGAPESIAVVSVVWADATLDLALLRLLHPVHDRQPLRLRPDPPASSKLRLSMIHHPMMGPKQISRGGRLLRHDGHDAIYLVDSAKGSAGAPVFDDEWRVVATHRATTNYRARTDEPAMPAKLGTASSAMVARLRDHAGMGSTAWREIVAAQPALRFVDPTLQSRLATMAEDDTLPVVVRLLDVEAKLADVPGFRVDSSAYGVVTGVGKRDAIATLTRHPQVQSIEASRTAASAECAVSVPHIGASRVHVGPHAERGEKVLVAVIDNGVDVLHESFRDEAGKTRILAYWDQHDARAPALTAQGAVADSPEAAALVQQFKVPYGALYVDTDIQRFIEGAALPPTFPRAADTWHGTIVSSIAAGRMCGTTEERFAGGVAPAAALTIVRYDLQNDSVGYSKGHVDALHFIDQLAALKRLPVVVNISNGMNAGAHDGTSKVETVCDEFTGNGKKAGRVVVKSAGNERRQGRHAMPNVTEGSVKSLRWRSQPRPKFGPSTRPEIVELWFDSAHKYRFCLLSPSGAASPIVDASHKDRMKCLEYLANGNFLKMTLTPHHDDNSDASLTVQVEPGRAAEVEKGEWTLEITGVSVSHQQPIHAWVEWMPDRDVFFQDYVNDEVTITIPGTAQHVISVGAIEVSDLMKSYDRSSWGPTRKRSEKPDIVAPGVGLYAAGADRHDLRSSKSESGTSLAAPHVTGAIALALSACAKSGRPLHNTNRIRSALKETARHRTGWSPETGWGELDAQAFFESLLT